MDYFSVIEGGAVILISRGVFRQVKLYQRSGLLFAGYGAGFVRLNRDGATSHKEIRWDQIDAAEFTYEKDGFFLKVTK